MINKFETYAMNALQMNSVKGGEWEKRIGYCDGKLTYYYWNSVTGECVTFIGNDADDCTSCDE